MLCVQVTRHNHRGPDSICVGVLLHLIEETAHHAGHADATREMLDGSRLW